MVCDRKEVVGGGLVAIHSGGQTVFSFSHIEEIKDFSLVKNKSETQSFQPT